jgi:hypothetical protein
VKVKVKVTSSAGADIRLTGRVRGRGAGRKANFATRFANVGPGDPAKVTMKLRRKSSVKKVQHLLAKDAKLRAVISATGTDSGGASGRATVTVKLKAKTRR